MADTEKKITSDMTIFEILQKYPETEEVIKEHFQGGCFACPASRMESIGDGAAVHGLDVDFILDELNKRASA
jgi:hybrid cluster-associated redox disulfide protein